MKLVLLLRSFQQRSRESQFLHLYNGSTILFQFSTLQNKQPHRNYSQSFLLGICQNSAWWFCPLAAELLAVVVQVTGLHWQLGRAGLNSSGGFTHSCLVPPSSSSALLLSMCRAWASSQHGGLGVVGLLT